MRRAAAALYGVLSYLAFLLPVGYLVGFLADVGVPKTIDRGAGPLGPALWVDVGLLVAFGLQHSVMARPGFKRAIERWVPASMERSTYVLVSGLTLALVYWLWRPIPAVLWDVSGTGLGILGWAGYGAGWALAVWATFALSHFYLFGVAQVAAYVRGREHPRMVLRSTLLYRIVRHPMTAGLMLTFWSTPRMTIGHLVFAGGMTVYSLWATVLEERDLVRKLGDSYRRYREQVPALLPILRPGLLLPRRAGLVVELLIVGLSLAFAGIIPLRNARASESPGQGQDPVEASETILGPSRRASAGRATGRDSARLEGVSLQVDGVTRTLQVYDPAPDHPGTRPLVLALHGTGGDARRLRTFLGGALERVATQRGWLVAYPEAIAGAWNDCRRTAAPPARAAGIDDVAFLRAVVDRLTRDRGVDPERVYVLGFSGGGHMAYRTALEDGTLARGIAVFAANLPTDAELVCVDRRESVPVMIVNGTRDLVNPYAGGDVIALLGRVLGRVRSAEETAQYFRGRPGGAEVVLVTVDGGGHAVPGPEGRFPPVVGKTVRAYGGVVSAAAFFARQAAEANREER